MRTPRCWMVVAITVFCLCLFAQVWIKTGLKHRQQPQPASLDSQELQAPTLGIVVPLSTEDMTHIIESLKRWLSKCSGTTLKSADLILYFAGEVPHEAQRHLLVRSDSMPCFREIRVVSAALRLEETGIDVIRSVQFYKLFLAPEIRASFVDYGALAIMDWDIIIAQETSFEKLYSATFTPSEPFWIKGSPLTGTCFNKNAVLSESLHRLDQLDGNAIYNNTDPEFVEFVNFTLARWQLTRPYGVALWATISDYPYSWPLWQRYASKFRAVKMVSTVETGGVKDTGEVVTTMIAPEAIFLRKCINSTESRLNSIQRPSHGCREACGSKVGESGIFETVCDATCVDDHSWMGRRYNGHNCGAGDPSKYGESCRLCFGDQRAALDVDKSLVALDENTWTPQVHVIMCETKRPPETIDCPPECRNNIQTICDRRCGNGRYRDWHCNWRGFGEKCRFCFHDITAARNADKIARESGGRVIMCETYEPPPDIHDWERITGITNLIQDDVGLESILSIPVEGADSKEPASIMDPAERPFIGDIMHRNVCVFIPGYFEFFHEARLAVDSVLDFMPGVKVVIATHPMDHHVFHRALGEPNAAVSIVNDTRVAYASLAADEACGNEVRLIYYMEPGEVLSRRFTAKDTHSTKGDLLVRYTEAEVAGGEYARHSMGTTSLLGFHGLSFTYESDLILPAEINAQLRSVLRAAMNKSGSTEKLGVCPQGESFGTCPFHQFLDSMSSGFITYASISIPELLGALLYLRSPVGVRFFDPSHQRHQLLAESTIWDVALVKPRFGCSIDLSLTLQGYDVAHQLSNHIEAFREGARCERGFIAVDPTSLKLKAEWEFPMGYPSSRMPSLQGFRISVMYRTFSGDAELFKISLQTAIKNIPDALEIVVVVEEADKDLFEEILAPHHASAPFPLLVMTEPSLMDGHIQQKYSKMQGDLYTKGDYILHLDSDVLVLHEVTYEDIFHLGKPALPFRRYRDDSHQAYWLRPRVDENALEKKKDGGYFFANAEIVTMYGEEAIRDLDNYAQSGKQTLGKQYSLPMFKENIYIEGRNKRALILERHTPRVGGYLCT